jgi:hypothetical protein
MSFEYLNGSSYPVIIVRTLAGALVEQINLELCNLGNGMKENWNESFKQVTLDKDDEIITYGFKGSRGTYVLDYSELNNAGNLLNIDKVFYYNSLPSLYKVYLRPRADVLAVRDEQVIISDDTFTIGLLPDRRGHTDTIIKFITKKTTSKKLQDLDLLSFPAPYFTWQDKP